MTFQALDVGTAALFIIRASTCIGNRKRIHMHTHIHTRALLVHCTIGAQLIFILGIFVYEDKER